MPFFRGSGRFFVGASPSLRLLLLQHDTQALDVAGQHRHGDVALEPFNAVVGAAVQAVAFQGVDRRFDGGVLAAQAEKLRLGFYRLGGFRELALPREHDLADVSMSIFIDGLSGLFDQID